MKPFDLSLVETSKPWGCVDFLHNGNETRFYSAVNRLNGDRLSAFNHNAPTINDLKGDRVTFKNILKSPGFILATSGPMLNPQTKGIK